MTKRMLSFFYIITCSSLLFAQRGRGYTSHIPDIRLPGGYEVLIGLSISVFAIPLGLLIYHLGKGKNGKEDNVFASCLGSIFVGGGVIALFPLIAWLFSALASIYAIGIVIFVFIVFLGLLFKKKQ